MERDDRLFTVIGSCVATGATAIVWLTVSGTPRTQDAQVTTSVPPAVESVALAGAESPPSEAPQVAAAVHRSDVIDDRDGLVRAAVRNASRHPEVLRWLMTDDLSHRTVEVVDAVAAGRIPRDHAAVVASDRPFLVYESNGGFAVAAGTARRFDPVVAGLASVDPMDAAALLAEIAPELEAAWSDRGGPGRFEERLRSAVDHLLAVRVPEGPLAVERRGRYYEWADDDLQRASPAQKALLRTGAGNARAIQSWLRRLRDAMEWPDPASAEGVLMAHASVDVTGGHLVTGSREGLTDPGEVATGTR